MIRPILLAALLGGAAAALANEPLAPGATIRIKLEGFPPTLPELDRGESMDMYVTATLPADYTPHGTFPMLVYLEGGAGGNGTSGSARFFTEDRRFVAVSMPLFKQRLNTDDRQHRLYIHSPDFRLIAQQYERIFQLLRARIPNLAHNGHVAAGFSNGAHSWGAVARSQTLRRMFSHYILAEGGLDFARLPPGSKALVLTGSNSPIAGRVRLQGRDVTYVTMQDVGHGFPAAYRTRARDWLREHYR